MDAKRFDGRVALVTGAASGIGAAIAKRLMDEGAFVVFCDRDAAALDRTVAAAPSRRAEGITADVSSYSDVQALFSQLEKLIPRLDILVNNAGLTLAAPFLEVSQELWNRQLSVNATGTLVCSQSAARMMMRNRYGRIVNLSSHSGQRGSTGRAAYAASKGAVDALTRVAAVELAEHGITVNAVAPGPVETPHSIKTHTNERRNTWKMFLPIARYATPTEVAAAVAFLASEEAAYITGQILMIDGGFTMAGLRPLHLHG